MAKGRVRRHTQRGNGVALTRIIREAFGKSRFVNLALALCFLAAQLVPSTLAVAASFDDSDYVVICTVDGFKKIPLSQLGLDPMGSDSPAGKMPAQDCPICLHICAKGFAALPPQTAFAALPNALDASVRLDRSSPVVWANRHATPAVPRAPPILL